MNTCPSCHRPATKRDGSDATGRPHDHPRSTPRHPRAPNHSHRTAVFGVFRGLKRVTPRRGETRRPRAQVSTDPGIEARDSTDDSRGGGQARPRAYTSRMQVIRAPEGISPQALSGRDTKPFHKLSDTAQEASGLFDESTFHSRSGHTKSKPQPTSEILVGA